MRITIKMLEEKGWHRVQTRHGWNLWAHGGIKDSYTFPQAAKIYKEREANKERVKIAFSIMAEQAAQRKRAKHG